MDARKRNASKWRSLSFMLAFAVLILFERISVLIIVIIILRLNFSIVQEFTDNQLYNLKGVDF